LTRYLFVIAVIVSAGLLLAQDIQVNRQNKTIAVTADDSGTADAEIAVLEIGYHNYAPTHDSAFYDNVRVADQITKAFLDAKVPRLTSRPTNCGCHGRRLTTSGPQR
jgi:hypothetical protein